jgi:Na+/H+-dicarboxylate symporter
MKLWQQVAIGLAAGALLGLAANGDAQYVALVKTYIKPVGDVFIKLIMMVVAPLIFFSLVQGVTSFSDSSSLGRIGLKATAAFLTTTFFAIIIGITVAIVMKPGIGTAIASSDLASDITQKVEFSFVNMITGVVPSNIIKAFHDNVMLQIVFVSIFTGITLNKLQSEDTKLLDFFHMMSKLVFKMMSIVINFSPYGVFSLTCWLITEQGIDVLSSLGKLLVAVIFAMLVQYIVFGVLIRVFAGLNPLPFYKKSFEYQALALSTSSTKASLITTMEICKNKLGISNSTTSFILPLGTSINMDGMAIYLSLCTIFFAQISGVILTMQDYIIIAITATLGSIGGAGVPGGSIMMLPMILSAVNLPIDPLKAVALIAGIDRIADMVRTMINITGDVTITLIIDKTEGTLNEELYLSKCDD